MKLHIGDWNCLRSRPDRSLPNMKFHIKLPWHGNRLVPLHRESPPRAAAAAREVGFPAQARFSQGRPGPTVRGDDIGIYIGISAIFLLPPRRPLDPPVWTILA